MKFTQIRSLPLIDVHKAQILGEIVGLAVDVACRRIVGIIAQGDALVVAPISAVYTIASDSVLTASSCSPDSSLYVSLPLGKSVYNTDGVYLGVLKDVLFEDNYRINELWYGETSITSKEVKSLSESVLIVKGELAFRKKRSKTSVKPKRPHLPTATTKGVPQDIEPVIKENVNALPPTETLSVDESPSSQTPLSQIAVENEQAVSRHTNRLTADCEFPLGRRLLRDLTDCYGACLYPVGKFVDDKVVQTAISHNRLSELLFCCADNSFYVAFPSESGT